MNIDEYRALKNEKVPMMSRAEYNRRYPNGVPRRMTSYFDTEEHIQDYRDWRSAIKRDDWDSGHAERSKWLWILALTVVVSIVVALVAGYIGAGVLVFVMLWFCIAFVEAGMNAPW